MAKQQSELKGLERPKVREIEQAADDYVRFRDKHKALGEEKKGAAEVLVAAMRRAKLDKYRYDGRVITLLEVDKVKIADADSDGDDDPHRSASRCERL